MIHRYFYSILFFVFGCFFCAIATSAQVNQQAPKDSLHVRPAIRQQINVDTLDADAKNEFDSLPLSEKKRLSDKDQSDILRWFWLVT